MPTLQIRQGEADRMARRFTNDACRERHDHLGRAALHALWFIQELRDAGLPDNRPLGSDVRDTLATIIDALSDAHGLIQKAADAENICVESFPLDDAELRELLASLDRPTSPAAARAA